MDIYAAEIETVNDIATLKGLEGLFQNVISVAIGFAGIAFFVMLLLGGFKLLTAGADAGKAESAKKTLTYAVYGLVAIALSYLFLVFIENFTGTSVTQFQIFRQ